MSDDEEFTPTPEDLSAVMGALGLKPAAVSLMIEICSAIGEREDALKLELTPDERTDLFMVVIDAVVGAALELGADKHRLFAGIRAGLRNL